MGIKETLGALLRRPDRNPVIAEGKKSPEISLEQDWQRQADKLAGLYAEELKFGTHEAYIASLPKFEPQPEQFKRRFDIPVIVETRVPLKRMLKLAGIVTYFDVDSIKDWDEGEFKTPSTPYTAWVNDGTSNLNKSVKAVRESLKSDERGANIYEVIVLYLRDPKILNHHYLDVPGSRVDSDDAPSLHRWVGRPGLYRSFVDVALPRYGSVVAGKI